MLDHVGFDRVHVCACLLFVWLPRLLSDFQKKKVGGDIDLFGLLLLQERSKITSGILIERGTAAHLYFLACLTY